MAPSHAANGALTPGCEGVSALLVEAQHHGFVASLVCVPLAVAAIVLANRPALKPG
jgi:hypothetical protein